MNTDLTFVQSETHRSILAELLTQAQRDRDVIGVMLLGSVARGDAYPGSDLDVLMLLNQGCSRAFQAEMRQGILVECKSAGFKLAQSKLEKNPMEVYAYLDGCILYDLEGGFGQLKAMARDRFETYNVSIEEQEAISYWLNSARIKIVTARDAGDMLKAACIISVTSWKILEGIWAVNRKPIPPAGGVWAHLKDLSNLPALIGTWLPVLFEGNTDDRIEAAVQIIAWVVPILRGAENPPSYKER